MCFFDYAQSSTRSSLLGILTRLLSVRSRVRFPVGAKDIFFSKASRPFLDPIQPPVQRLVGFFPRDKAAGAHPPTSAAVENEWNFFLFNDSHPFVLCQSNIIIFSLQTQQFVIKLQSLKLLIIVIL
jgi:hypothetical protein